MSGGLQFSGVKGLFAQMIKFKGNNSAEIKWRLLGLLGKLAIDLICITLRIETEGDDQVAEIISRKKFILAAWHSRLLLVSYLHKRLNGVALVSRSEDGELVARILHWQGQEAVRGSTSKGGLEALRALVKRIKGRSRPAAIVPDGPRGPRSRVQPGVVYLAKLTGYPIVPVTYSARRVKVFSSWDRFLLPWPGSECRIVYGKPLRVPKTADRDQMEHYRRLLEANLRCITAEADRHYGHFIG